MTVPSARVLLVVTGDLEEVALGDALKSVFPTLDFRTKRARNFTTGDVGLVDLTVAASKSEDLVERLLSAMVPEVPGEAPFDYAIGFEDVELLNDPLTEPRDAGIERILGHLRHGIDLVLRRPSQPSLSSVVIPKGYARKAPPSPTLEARRQFLRERCSFHLFRPMPEALFFGAPQGVQSAAGPHIALPPVHFDRFVTDIEAFVTNDPGYLAPPDNWKPEGALRSAPWAKANRARHPKHYVEYLLDPTGTARRAYKEKEHGARALSALCWKDVVSPPNHAQMVRALLDDLADMAGTPLPWLGAHAMHPLTCRKPKGRLRNLL